MSAAEDSEKGRKRVRMREHAVAVKREPNRRQRRHRGRQSRLRRRRLRREIKGKRLRVRDELRWVPTQEDVKEKSRVRVVVNVVAGIDRGSAGVGVRAGLQRCRDRREHSRSVFAREGGERADDCGARSRRRCCRRDAIGKDSHRRGQPFVGGQLRGEPGSRRETVPRSAEEKAQAAERKSAKSTSVVQRRCGRSSTVSSSWREPVACGQTGEKQGG
jgi:hypothetical protein